MTRKTDHRRLGQLRQGQGEIANHIIDEFAAGRLSRRDFIRRGTVVGISMPLLGSILAACGSSGSSSSAAPGTSASASGKAGAVIKAGITTPTGAINPVTLFDQGGLDMLGQTGEYLCLSGQTLNLTPQLATSWTPNSTANVWTFKIRQGVKFHNGSPLTADDVVYTFQLHTNPKSGSNSLSALPNTVLKPSGVVKVDDFTVAFHLEAPNGNFPYLVSSDNYNVIILPKGYDPAKWGKLLHWHRTVRAQLVHAEIRGHVHPERAVLGQEGAAVADPVHVLRHPVSADPRTDRRDDRRRRAVLRVRRPGTAHRQLQHHQAEVERAPPVVDALRSGAVQRPAGPAGDRAHAQPAADRPGAFQGLRRPRQRQPVRAPSSRRRTPASPSGRRTSARPSPCSRRQDTPRDSAPSWSPRRSRRSRSTPRSSRNSQRRSA